ncbi:MAG: SusC/RagA family TonB-linked outer membrane protein [Gracilimonas sp.]|uniref:SusC/RagA family TonB-linked outer membrane protein n=1 Tax=Gracilimonas sp. TaxID=1974203 RepID=UPI0019B692AB|nr:SusC/RagA family TonB-linked outer membrane protein [Gracilimonas sp.]MBD3615945.1 SusC/RagA family TonB-linked outer membrane protein [Gracilimonas sp.]
MAFPLMIALLFSGMGQTEAIAQDRMTVSGIVTDGETGESLPGVNILVVGTTTGTSTDSDGYYEFQVPSLQDTLSFSFLGFQKILVPIDGRTEINVELRPQTISGEEVVVIGYGTQQQGDNTGSVNSISASDFNQGNITSPQELFQGKAAGVSVTSSDGAPGSGATIRIRGGSSLSASNDPLFVVDGVPLDGGGVAGMRNPLNTINPNDIESINILKDASATAIYGSRASNGVIIINTKKGRVGQGLDVNYSTRLSYQANQKRVEMLSADQFREVIEEQFGTNGTDRLGDSNTNWQDEIYRNAFGQDHNINITGAYQNIPYRVSLGFSGNEGILRTDRNDRLTGSVSLNPTFFDDQLKVNLNLKGMQVQNQFGNQGAIGSAVIFDPTQPVEGDNYGGYFTWVDNQGRPNPLAPANPVALLEQRTDESTVYRTIGNLEIDYALPFVSGLNAILNVGVDYSDVAEGDIAVPENAAFEFTGDPETSGVRVDYDQKKENELLDFYLNYQKEVADWQSSFDVIAGYSWEHHYADGFNYVTNFDRADEANLDVRADTDYATENYIVSFFGRLNYEFKDKYLLTATLRQDGTSRFSEDNRWGLFPSAAVAWKIHEEAFLDNADAITELKLRLGYGVTGQQNIGQGDYPYLPVYTYSEPTAQYQFGNQFITTLRPEGYNPDLKWEETTTYNVGLDYSLFNDRIFGKVEGYYRETNDLLNVVPVAAGSNFTNRILSNVGTLEVKGVEFEITGRLVNTQDTYWELGVNVSKNTDEITKLTTVDDPSYIGVETGGISGGVGNTIQLHSVGFPRSSFYVFEQVYNADGTPIEGLYVDRNGDGVINEADKYRYESPSADYEFGFSSRVEYKNWDASFAGHASVGNHVYNNVKSSNAFYSEMLYEGYLRNAPASVLETNFTNAQFFSDHFVENASFLRLDNINLGYTFNSVFDVINSLRVSATVQNVFVITNYSGLDPEVFGGIDNNIYPRPRTFVLGLNLNF